MPAEKSEINAQSLKGGLISKIYGIAKAIP